jgi:hypothetical protein
MNPVSSSSLSAMLMVILMLVSGCGRSEQFTSEDAENAVDSLYTAITARRTDLLQKSEQRLTELHAKGEIPKGLHQELNEIIATSRNNWSSAAQQLDALMRSLNE